MVVVKAQSVKKNGFAPMRTAGSMAVTFMLLSLVACGSKDKAPGQSLVRVDGQEITIHQVSEELARNNVPVEQRDAATKQIVEALIDRQLLQSEAMRDKVDRDPSVVQAIERAKAQIIAQAYMQKRIAKIGKPTKEDVEKYYTDHADYFSNRKTFEMEQIMISTKDFSSEIKASLNSGKTLDDVAALVKEHHIEFLRSAVTRSTLDLPPALIKKLKDVRKGQLFALQEGDKSIIVVIKNTKDEPVKLDVAQAKIDSFLSNQRNKDAAAAELERLRSAAKIEYLNKKSTDSGAAAPTDPVKKTEPSVDHVKRGIADL